MRKSSLVDADAPPPSQSRLTGGSRAAPPLPPRTADPRRGSALKSAVNGTEAGRVSLEEARAKAEISAKVLVERRFKEPANLEDLKDVRAEYRRRLAAMDSQLSTVVRARLDGVKRARDLIEDSAAQTADLHTQFAKMEALSRDCRGLFGTYPHIKRLHHARSNLASTARLVEFFFGIPGRAQALADLLKEQPRQIKVVYEGAAELEAWRDSFMAALKLYGSSALTRTRDAYGGDREGADARKYQRIVERAGPSLNAVLQLVTALRRQVVVNVAGETDEQGGWGGGGCLELAMTQPSLLVSSLEVAELMRARQRRRYQAAQQAAVESGIDPEEALAGLESGEELYSELMASLKRGLDLKIGTQFAQMQMGAVDAGESKVMATLNAANSLLVDLDAVETYVAPCFPPSYGVMQVFKEAYTGFLMSLLLPMVASDDRMAEHDVRDILEAIKWLQYYNNKVEKCEAFAKAIVGLNAAYLGRIKGQMFQWVTNLQDRKQELMQDLNGRYITTFPEDMLQLIGIQLSVAKQCLPSEYWPEMVLTCLQVLQEVQEQSRRRLAHRWRDLHAMEDGLEQFCGIVNDCDRLQDKADEFIKDMMSGMEDGLSKQESARLAEKIESVATEYVETAAAASAHISSSVLLTLAEAGVTERFFTPEWEDGSFEGMKTVVETLADFFRDLHKWMPDFFFAKMARSCLERVIKMYVEALLRGERKAFGLPPAVAGGRIADDMHLLMEFFMSGQLAADDAEDGEEQPAGADMAGFMAQAGLRTPGDFADQWKTVSQINTILCADSMDTLPGSVTQAAIKAIFLEFGQLGYDAIMQILELQKRWSGEERQQRVEFITRIGNTLGDLSQRSSTRYELKGYKAAGSFVGGGGAAGRARKPPGK